MLRWAEVHLDRLIRNFKKVEELSKKRIYAVVKANAYGHGSVQVAKTLEENTSVYGFCVATYEEGAELRQSGIKKPILVMSSTISEGRKFLKEYQLTPVVYDFEELKLVKELSIPFHLKVDTGMGRLGFLESEWNKLLEEIRGTKLIGVMTHFSSADEDYEYTKFQLGKFKSFVDKLKRNFKKVEVHSENSAAVRFKLNGILTHSRVGLSLYGVEPCEGYPKLEQVMEVKAKVLTVKELPPNFSVSYSKTYRTKEKERIAVVSFGYADGYPRELSNRGKFLLNGEVCPVRGRVCMDMTVVSVNNVKVEKGDTAIIYGEEIPFKEVSKEIGKIPYELMCSISQRVRRIYRKTTG
jgi:alanine racemase